MTEFKNSSSADWHRVAELALRSSASPVQCPACQAVALTAAWHLTDFLARQATVDLCCSSCGQSGNVRMVIPRDVPDFFPLDRLPLVAGIVQQQAEAITQRIRKYVHAMPAAGFTTHPLWAEARWSATTFVFHPTSESPPVMGLVFDNAEAGKEIFREAEKQMNHLDRFEEIRISIIEGHVPGQEQRPGYSVHICPDPESLAAHATMDDLVLDPRIVPFLGQWTRAYPIPGAPAMLPRFKQEFDRHREFMLAPVTQRDDGQLYAEVEIGIIKNSIEFRNLSTITQTDTDAAALLLPQLITPPPLAHHGRLL